MLNTDSMITIVIAGYAALMLTIVVALFKSATRPAPKPSGIVLDDYSVRRAPRPVFMPTIQTSTHGGAEVLAFEA